MSRRRRRRRQARERGLGQRLNRPALAHDPSEMRRIAVLTAGCCLLFVAHAATTTPGTALRTPRELDRAPRRPVGAPAGQRPGGPRPGGLHDRDRQSVLAHLARQAVGLHLGGRANRRDPHEPQEDVEGIDAVVVTDIVTQRNGGGAYVEVTKDWYAQDADGNVWYLGEDTEEYENGEVASTAGSWEHGVRDGAYAGIIIPADPKPGLEYRQEYYKGEAEDVAEVLSLDATATVPFRDLRELPPDPGHDIARARRPRAQVLREERGSGASHERRGRRARGTRHLHEGVGDERRRRDPRGPWPEEGLR